MSGLDLTFVEKLVESCFHRGGPGRPPRKPLGLFKAHLVRRFLKIGSLRGLERKLWSDERLRGICDIEVEELAYGRSVLSRFNRRLGGRRVKRLVDWQVKKLIRRRVVKVKTVALDATFIKAYSRRSKDNRTGYSDPEARVGRAYQTYGLGYKLHMAVDVASGAPLTFMVAPANTNEKKLSIPLLKTTIKTVGARIWQLTADSQYSKQQTKGTRTRTWNQNSNTLPSKPEAGKTKHSQSNRRLQNPWPGNPETHIQETVDDRAGIRMAQGTSKPQQPQDKGDGKPHHPLRVLHPKPPIHYRSITQHKPPNQIKKHNLLGN